MKKRIDSDKITKTFLEYTLINTTSVPTSQNLPSSENQFKLAQHVVSQFAHHAGVSVEIKDNAITTITLPRIFPTPRQSYSLATSIPRRTTPVIPMRCA